MTGSRAALRIARRDAQRAKGRTTLVICMIGVPVMAIVAMAVLIHTAHWSDRERLPYTLGHADARVYGSQHTAVRQAPLHPEAAVDAAGMDASQPTGDDEPWTTAEITSVMTGRFGPGTRVIPVREDGGSELRTRLGYLRLQTYEIDLRDPLARGMLTVTAGRAPATANEVTVSQALRERGFEIGDTIQIDRRGTAKRIVGYVDQPVDGGEMILQALPGALPASGNAMQSWLVSAGRPVGWPEVKELNGSGLTLLSRAVVLDPPPASESPAELGFGQGPSTAEVAIIAMVVSMIVLEVVLLAGPAFAVGIRRQRRMLALVGAQGGHARQLKAIVLAGGLVLGGTAALLGALAGLGLAGAAIPVIERVTGTPYGPFEVPWTLVAAPMVLGLLSGLAAAYLPARQAARMNVVAALAGRRDPVRPRHGWPIAGGVLVASGIGVSLLGTRIVREFGAAAGAIAIVVGCVMAGPWIVRQAGRCARWLPLPLRLAVRDGVRNGGRTAPAVAATMAAVAGLTALAIGGASDFAQREFEYRPQIPMGSARINADARQADQIMQMVRQELPGVPTIRFTALPDPWADDPDNCRPPDGCTGLELAVGGSIWNGATLVGGPQQARFLLGSDDPAVAAALRAGTVVLLGAELPPVRTAEARIVRNVNGGESTGLRSVRLPAVAVPAREAQTLALIPPTVARTLDLPVGYAFDAIDRADHRLTTAEEARLAERISAVTDAEPLYVERGFTESNRMMYLILGLTGVIMVLGGSLVATGLAAADARPDLVTLAAVGARPRTRRLLAMGQAGFVALLGSVVGLAAGTVPGLAVAVPLTSNSADSGFGITGGAPEHGAIIDVPWLLLLGVGLGVPMLAALAAGLFTRSRLQDRAPVRPADA